MADYNVQMKQYNGTSFDNILPYASQALTLAGGGSATEIIAQARAGLSHIATGSYVGTGLNSEGDTILNLTFEFEPKILIIFQPLDNRKKLAQVKTTSRFANTKFAGINETGEATGDLVNSYDTETGMGFHYSIPNFSIWYKGLETCYLATRDTGYANQRLSCIETFTLSGNTLTAKLSKESVGSFYALLPYTLFNYSGWTYNWIAFG